MSALSILAEECELLNDSKYRSYITQIEKALKSFDSTSEWADLISALGKLNKVLLAHVKYSVIPKRVTIGKRLAQCLHPALPSGVHMKALETYDIIFKCIGTERLAQDLFIYSAGLFPLLSHAAMNVKPALLMIYEKHFVNLRQRIKPGLNGLLLGLLPGLEEGSEFYDRTNALLEDFAEGTELSYFYTCLWECIHSCPSVRLPATVYLLTHFNKKQTMEDQLHMIGLNINLMIEAICSAVQDTSVLVQRSMLDFLLFAFPLHNSQLTRSDMAKVVKYAINVLLRRDMSLNRRFYAWLLGTSTTSASTPAESSELTELSYFEKYSQDLLIQALKYKLTERLDSQTAGSPNMKSTMLRPFRILISLLDKPEIGPIILESVLLSIFRCLHREFELSTSKSPTQSSKKTKGETNAYDELLKTANLLFGTFEPYFIWDYAARMFHQSCSNSGKKLLRRTSSSISRHSRTHEEYVGVGELCQLVAFLLDIVSLETFSETQTEHLPNLLCSIITSLTEYCDKLSDSDVITSLQLCTKILSKVQPTMTTSGSHDLSCDESHDVVEKVEVNSSGEVTSQKAEVVEPMSVEEALEMNRNLKKEELEKDTNGKSVEDIDKDTPDSETSTGSTTGSSENRKISDDMKENDEPVKKNETGFTTSATGVQSRKHSKQNQSINLMQKCIDCFQEFFHELVTQKFLKEGKMSETCFGNIVTSQTGFETYDASEEDLFSSCDNKGSSSCDRKIILENENEDSSMTFATACQLLVEFASFPMYGEDMRSSEKQMQKESATVPLWVKDLVTCCCFVHNFHMQSSAISTMLDLIILTQSLQVEHRTDNSGNQTGSGHMTIQILPTLHWEDLKFLSEHTEFFKMAAEILWGFLNEQTPQYHQTTVKLFYMLHQAAPSGWICENVIGNQLIHENQSVQTDAYKKFSVLWHLTRNKKTDVIPGKPLRTFNRSMFVILDSLKDETSPLKVIATTWLTHVIQQGDINRVMEPVLQMLLHPDTARVSVQHVNVHQPRKVCLSESSEESLEANIYAISSEGGNVIYHVSSPKDVPKKQFSDELKSYALTVLGDKGAHTAPVRTRSEQELHFDKVDPASVSLRINPFGSENSLDGLALDLGQAPTLKDSTVNKAKRLDKQTCAKEGILFTENEESNKEETTGEETDGNDSVSDSAENIAKSIIDEILRNVTKGSESATASTESLKDVVKPQKKKLPERADSINSFTAADELLNSVQRQRVDSPTPSEKDIAMFQEVDKDTTNIHTLHMHMLLYIQKYDYQRTLYALSTLKAMLIACPRNMVTALITTNISTLRSTQLAKLQLLLARHRKSVFGKNFFGEIPADVMSNYRSSMFIEILISVCLYFLRGYYPNLMMSKMSYEELLGNKQVHILATETLTLMMSEIVSLMRDSGKKLGLGSYISDLLQRCKVQKALLHCILAEIYNGRRKLDKEQFGQKITEAIIAFNEDRIDPSANEAFQIKLLDLLLVMIMLEEQIGKFQSLPETTPTSEWDRLKVNYQPSLKNVRYNLGHPIMQQGMFVSGVLSALKQTHTCHMHRHWVAMVTSALPYMGKYLPGIVMTVVSQLCRNIEALAAQYESDGKSSASRYEKIPPDHVLTMLSGLMTLCHYCLLDNMSPVSIGQQAPSNSGNSTATTSVNTNILTNLFHVFNPVGGSKELSPQRDVGTMSPVLEARNSILSVMPRIIACMAALWRAINIVEKQEDSPVLTMGSPKVVRQYILEFISPISLPHGLHLLGAIAVAWNDRRKRVAVKNNRKVLPTPCEDQLLLVDLVGAIKVFPTDTLVQTVKEVLNNPPSSELSRAKKGVPLEVNMLQFFYAYVQRTSANQLVDSWSSLSSLLKESLQLGLVAPGQFLLLLILNEFVQKTPSMVDKKKREIQEIAQKLLEAVSNIAGSSLEQTTWLRKNYAVKPGPQSDEPEEGNQPDDDSVVMEKRVVELEPTSVNTADSKYSVQALAALAEITAPLLDVIYTSDEKDRVSPFLTTLLYNIFPYLKNHNTNNLPSLRVASQFLSSISSYQYTRKAWRREALDLLLDGSFFQMDMESIGYWVTIVDNLMTHDKTTYKDLMARVSMAQTGSLNLFSNKEQEIDQKAGMLKRLAFTVYCSEADQYQKSIPEIQEKLAESLRIPQAPSVMAQVFLCFRVLMLRVSPQHLTSMWPTIITELIHVFLQIEQELSTETEEFVTQVQRIAALDSSWAHLGNGLNAHNNPSWMQLYLSACKLLDTCLALPADNVPQFQLYRWAFIGGAAAGEGEDDIGEEERKKKDPRGKQKQFKPHIIRLAKLLNNKLKGDIPMMKMVPGRPLLTFTHLRSLQELQPFFNTLCLANQTDNLLLAARQLGASSSHNQSNALTNGHAGMKTSLQLETKDLIGRGMPKSKSTPSFPVSQSSKSETAVADSKSSQQFIEEVLMRDFLEPMS